MDAASNRRRSGRGAQEQTGAGAADSGNPAHLYHRRWTFLPHRLDGRLFPGGHRPEPPVGVHGVRPVRRADRPAGRLPRDAGLLPAAGSALPGPQDHADCDLGHGDSDLCGRLSEYHDPEHLHAQAHRPAEGAPGDPVLHHRLHRRAGVRPAALLHLGGVLCRAVLRRGGHPGAGLRERHQHLLRCDPLHLLRHRGGGAGAPVLPGAGAQAGADEEGLPPGGGDRKGLLAGERRAESGGRGRLPGHYRLPVGLCAPHRHADRLDYRGGRAVPGPGGRHRRVLFALHPPEEAVSH